MCVCVCVCVLRERERERERGRERERERELYPFPDLPTPKYICQYSKVSVSVFSDLWLDYLVWFGLFFVCFVLFLWMHHQSIKTKKKKKVSNDNFRQTCGISLWTPTPVSNVIPIVFSIPNSISAILNIYWSFTSEFKGLRTKFISVFALDSRQYRPRFNLFHFLKQPWLLSLTVLLWV